MCSIRPEPSMSAITKVSPAGTTLKSRLPPVWSQLDSRRERPALMWARPPSGLFGCQNSMLLVRFYWVVVRMPVVGGCRGSALDRTEREPGDDVALEEEGEEDDRDGVDRGERGHAAPVQAELALEVRDHDRRGLRADRGEQQREEELVPRGEEGEDRGHRHAAGDHGDHDPPQGLQPGASVDLRGLAEPAGPPPQNPPQAT